MPTFEQWREYCFTQGHADFSTFDDAAASERAERFLSIPAPTAADYLCTLFENAAALEALYTPDQIGDATWFIFGVGSGYFGDIRCQGASHDQQVRVYGSMLRMYTDLYDRLCNQRGRSLDDHTGSDKLDIAVFMIWDMGCVEGAVMFPDTSPHLVEPGFATLRGILERCNTGSCLKGALHALGHLRDYHPERAGELIDRFISARGPGLPTWLIGYAERARSGCVQ